MIIIVSQRVFSKAFPTNQGVLSNYKDPPMHACKFRASWREHGGAKAAIYNMHYVCSAFTNNEGIARKFVMLNLSVAHTSRIHHLRRLKL